MGMLTGFSPEAYILLFFLLSFAKINLIYFS